MITSRRSFITGLVSLVAAPAIVRAGSLMPVRSVEWSIGELPVWGRGPAMDALGTLQEQNLQVVLDLKRIHEAIVRAFMIPPHYLRDDR